jgi:hypothetical protein
MCASQQQERRLPQKEAARPASSSNSSLSFGQAEPAGRPGPQQQLHGPGGSWPAAVAAAERSRGSRAWGEWQRAGTPLTQQQRRRPEEPAAQVHAQGGQDWWAAEFDSLQQEPSQQSESEEAQSLDSQQHWQQGMRGRPSGPGLSTVRPGESCSQQQDGCVGARVGGQAQEYRHPAAVSRGSLGTFSLQCSGAPSGATSWLDAAYEPDIEQLEINSARKPMPVAAAAAVPQRQQRQAPAVQDQAGDGLATLFDLATGELDWDCL